MGLWLMVSIVMEELSWASSSAGLWCRPPTPSNIPRIGWMTKHDQGNNLRSSACPYLRCSNCYTALPASSLSPKIDLKLSWTSLLRLSPLRSRSTRPLRSLRRVDIANRKSFLDVHFDTHKAYSTAVSSGIVEWSA